MWFVTRRRYEDELAAAKSEIRRQRERAEQAETAESNREQILRQRLDRALHGCARWMDATWVEVRHCDHLQQRLDDAVGLTAKGIADSSRWQPGYKPTPKPGGTS